MPELPDVTIYIEALQRRVMGHTLHRVRLASPFLLRTFEPPLDAAFGKKVIGIHRIGKRIVLELEDQLFVVIHLMIAGRLRWTDSAASLDGKAPEKEQKIPGKIGLASFHFSTGVLVMTEAGSKRRASLHVISGRQQLEALDPGGSEVSLMSVKDFGEALRKENHTVKRVLTDPKLFSGIGNAYSDEILHRARISPLKLTQSFSDEEVMRLLSAANGVLREWTQRLREETGEGFPARVTAFRPEMAVHGKFGQPCPDCGSPVQRIVYADNETNYCARCQTGGKVLADRALSRLLKSDWPRSIDDLE